MTIRSRLIAAAFLSSAMVAGAAAVSTAFLFDAARHLDVIRTDHLSLLDSTKKLVDCASALSMSLDDYVEATEIGDRQNAEIFRTKADAEFERLKYAIQSAEQNMQHEGQTLPAFRIAQLETLRSQMDSLAQVWHRIETTKFASAEHFEAADLDDRAMKIVTQGVSLQDYVSEGVEDAVTKADVRIRLVCWLSIAIAVSMTLITLITGTIFASQLTRRLVRVKDQAERVGEGQLETTLEVHGEDEIDEIAISFNEMVRELRSSRTKLEHDALYDPLTGLPNRAHFLAKLTERIEKATATADHDYAVYFIDVDRFKQINDTLGHAAGDDLLRNVAGRLTAVTDQLSLAQSIVARLGGDEFTILVESITSRDAEALGERLRSASAVTMTVGGKPVVITLSIGLALGSESISEPKQILSHADAALYQTKRGGRNGCTLFSESMMASANNTALRAYRDNRDEAVAR